MKLDPIIAVEDVEASSSWYQTVFGCQSRHGGKTFDVLVVQEEVVICLHQWGAHEHPTMVNTSATPGNGLILYFRTDKMDQVLKNAEKIGASIESEVYINTNTRQREFALRDPDGYYIIVSEFHGY